MRASDIFAIVIGSNDGSSKCCRPLSCAGVRSVRRGRAIIRARGQGRL